MLFSPPLLLPAFLWSPVYSAPRICLKQWLLPLLCRTDVLCYPDRFSMATTGISTVTDCIQGLHCHGTRICFVLVPNVIAAQIIRTCCLGFSGLVHCFCRNFQYTVRPQAFWPQTPPYRFGPHVGRPRGRPGPAPDCRQS